MKTSHDVIRILNLKPLPFEGGFYTETHRSSLEVETSYGKMSALTSIFYLVTTDSFSALHQVDMDEVFHFYAGSPVEMFQIDQNGRGSFVTLGSDIFNGQIPQLTVPRGVWQGTKLKMIREGDWALLGCNVAPGYEQERFHIKSRTELTTEFPHLKDAIARYTHH